MIILNLLVQQPAFSKVKEQKSDQENLFYSDTKQIETDSNISTECTDHFLWLNRQKINIEILNAKPSFSRLLTRIAGF